MNVHRINTVDVREAQHTLWVSKPRAAAHVCETLTTHRLLPNVMEWSENGHAISADVVFEYPSRAHSS